MSRALRALACVCVSGLFAAVQEVVAKEHEDHITAHDLAMLVDFDGLAVSPDGRWAAFQMRQADPARNGYDIAWYVASIRNQSPVRRIGDAGEPIQATYKGRIVGTLRVPAPVWSPDSRWIAYLRKENDRVHVWRSSRVGSHTEQLTHNDADARVLAISADGRRLFFETEPSRAQTDVAIAREGLGGFLYDRRFHPSYDRTPRLPADVSYTGETPDAVAGRQVWVLQIDARRERRPTKAEQAEFAALNAVPTIGGRPALSNPPGSAGFPGAIASSSGGALAWTEALDPAQQGGFAPLTIIAHPSGRKAPIVCGAPECTGQSIKGIWWRTPAELVFSRGEGPYLQDTAIYAWSLDESRPRLILRTPNKLTSCTIAQDRLVCFYEQPDYPRRLVALNPDNGLIETIYDPNPGFARFDLGRPPQRLTIHSPSGVETYGYLVLPPQHRTDAPLPLIIVTYRCGGFLRGGTGDEYPIYPFAAQGFAVLCFNIPTEDFARLAREDIAAYTRWGRGEGDPLKRQIQESLDAAVELIAAGGIVDRQRVGITGLSYGAETVSFALHSMRNTVAAAIVSGPGLEPMDYYLYGPAGREWLNSFGLSAPDGAGAKRWAALALSANVDHVNAPFLLHVADSEMLTTLQPITALEDAGRAVEMYVFPGEYHIKWQPAHRLAIYNRNIDWMNFWLRGIEDHDPIKAPQYERWRALRDKQCKLVTGASAPWYCRE